MLGCTGWLVSCAEGSDLPSTSTNNASAQLPLTLAVIDQTIVSGGSLAVEARGGNLLVPDVATIELEGRLGGNAFSRTFSANLRKEEDRLLLQVPWEQLSELLGNAEQTEFQGTITATVQDLTGNARGHGQTGPTTLRIVKQLFPQIEIPTTLELYLNDTRELSAEGLLKPGEGVTVVELSGMYTSEQGEIHSVQQRVEVVSNSARNLASLHFPASLFGFQPGTFQGDIAVINEHAQASALLGNIQPIEIQQRQTIIEGFDPPEASRGQQITMIGKGFIPSDTSPGQSMYILLEGSFQTTTGEVVALEGATSLQIIPEEVPSHTGALLTLRTESLTLPNGTQQLVGFTARPGTFMGTITPILVSATEMQSGEPWEGSFSIKTTEQRVFLKYLPGFSDALDRFGLRNVEPEIRTRIFQVLQRDYRGINITFLEDRPTDFVEYSIIEIGGSDPNGVGLFGLDNTAGKDTSNIRLNDIIGGVNAETEELGFFSYGGVFINSFDQFSPTLEEESEFSSPWFDTLYIHFMPELGGTPIEADEWPSGPRSPEINEAIRTMGNLVGNTISHEIGHSLGLAFFPEDLETPSERFHNEEDEPNILMDAGLNRPFEERAEVDGQGPARFNNRNLNYLESILPLRP